MKIQENKENNEVKTPFTYTKSKKSLKVRLLTFVAIFIGVLVANFIWKRSQATLFGEDKNIYMMIKPIAVDIDVNDLKNGIYPVKFCQDSVHLVTNGCVIEFEIFSHDFYDAKLLQSMKVGDSILVGKNIYPIDSFYTRNNTIYVNGGLDHVDVGGLDLNCEDNGQYCFRGFSDATTYTSHGKVKMFVSSGLQFIDKGNVKESMDGVIVEGKNIGKYLKQTDWTGYYEQNTRIKVENGKVVEFFREYHP